MSKPNSRIMDIDESPKGRNGIEEMLERINKMNEDISHEEEKVRDSA